MGERSDGWTKAFSVPLSIPPVPCYTFFMKAARRAQAYILPHKNCIFLQKALDTKRARRIMPLLPVTCYLLPVTCYLLPVTRAKVRCSDAVYFCATSLRIPQTRGHIAFRFLLYFTKYCYSRFYSCAGANRSFCLCFPLPEKRRGIDTYIHSVL